MYFYQYFTQDFYMYFWLQMTTVRSTTAHSHDADQLAIEAMKVKAELKTKVKTTKARTSQIVADTLAPYPAEVMLLSVC